MDFGGLCGFTGFFGGFFIHFHPPHSNVSRGLYRHISRRQNRLPRFTAMRPRSKEHQFVTLTLVTFPTPSTAFLVFLSAVDPLAFDSLTGDRRRRQTTSIFDWRKRIFRKFLHFPFFCKTSFKMLYINLLEKMDPRCRGYSLVVKKPNLDEQCG